MSIERFQNPRRVVRRPVIGGRYQLHVTAIGQVLLAFAPKHVQEEVLGGDLPAYTPNTYTDRATLERVLADIRRTGYAVSDRQVDMAHLGVAAPVRDASGQVIAAVSLALTGTDANERGAVHLVRLTATSISRALTAAGYGSDAA